MPTDPDKIWTPHLRISFGGTIGDTSVGEIWSNTIRYVLAGQAAPSANTLQTVADNVAAPLSAWFSSAAALISSVANLTYVKATWVLDTGKQRDSNTAQHEYAAPGPTGGHSFNPIWEQSYVITLRSGLKRGRGHAGRIYPPLSGNGPTGVTPYCSAADATGMAHAFALGMTQIATAISNVVEPGGPTGGFAVVSPGSRNAGTLPLYQYIQTVVVDRVADIMHSRTNRVKRLEGTPSPIPENA